MMDATREEGGGPRKRQKIGGTSNEMFRPAWPDSAEIEGDSSTPSPVPPYESATAMDTSSSSTTLGLTTLGFAPPASLGLGGSTYSCAPSIQPNSLGLAQHYGPSSSGNIHYSNPGYPSFPHDYHAHYPGTESGYGHQSGDNIRMSDPNAVWSAMHMGPMSANNSNNGFHMDPRLYNGGVGFSSVAQLHAMHLSSLQPPHHVMFTSPHTAYSNTPSASSPMSPHIIPLHNSGAGFSPAAAASTSAPMANAPALKLPPVAAAPPPSNSQNVVAHVAAFIEEFRTALDRMRWQQKSALDAGDAEALHRIRDEQTRLRAMTDAALAEIRKLHQSELLPPKHVHKLWSFQRDFEYLLKQLELYSNEISSPNEISAALFITQQPFPRSIKYGVQLDDAVEVRLLTGCRIDSFRPIGHVTADIAYEEFVASKKKLAASGSGGNGMAAGGGGSDDGDDVAVTNDVRPMDANGVALFSQLKFPKGSRVKPVRLTFSASIAVATGTATGTADLVSPPSEPFVVITNEKQWELAEAALLKKYAFVGNASEITWEQFTNCLQLQYLRATKQDPVNPCRPLSADNFDYFHKAFFAGRPVVTQRAFDEFWEWFGKVMHKIRHQKHLLPLWNNGLIYGFISRAACNELLRNAHPGTFLVRFSEQQPGQCAVAFVKSDPSKGRDVKHYLLKPEDLGVTNTLPDFLREYEKLVYLIQVRIDEATGRPTLTVGEKDNFLKDFYTKRTNEALAGYVPKQDL